MSKPDKGPARQFRGVLWALLIAGLAITQAEASQDQGTQPLPGLTHAQVVSKTRDGKLADFDQMQASGEVRHLAHWIVDSGDNMGKPFVIVDKREARVFVFDGGGSLRGSSPALLGLAIGDHSVPGIGDRKLSDIRPEERTTPAGRFVSNLDKNLKGQEMLWVDYDTAISMHPVVPGHPRERRAQRLAGSSAAERRISYGCINVPPSFFKHVLSPVFTGTDGVVYVLPEIWLTRDVFGSYDVEGDARFQKLDKR